MSSVSGCGGSSAAAYQGVHAARASQAQRSQELFAKLDVNGDSAIDTDELKAFTDFVSEKTGGSSIDTDGLMKALDSDGDGKVSGSELTDNAKSLFDALRQQLTGTGMGGGGADGAAAAPDADELFAAIDTDGDGSVSADEFKAGMNQGHRGPPPPPPGDGQGGGSGEVGRLIASLLEQYGASSSAGANSTSAFSAAA
ncbi:MAG TPA: EF-hand domain-containing protein [Steroidobacteraceae bacterium]|nr:EF-hand domain-containing protein [Steroidobacteraceae bacterium]